MSRKNCIPILLTLLIACPRMLSAMPGDSTLKLPGRYLDEVDAKTQSVNTALSQKTQRYLQKFASIENKLLSRLRQSDPSGVSLPAAQYGQLGAAMLHPDTIQAPTTYLAGLDTLSTTLQYLKSRATSPGIANIDPAALNRANADARQLQARLDESALIQQYISQRSRELSQLVGRYSNLPSGITRLFTGYKTTAYYYRQQVEQYKAMLNDPQKIERTAIMLLSKTSAYQTFLAKNSLLAGLFRLPAGYGSNASLQGMQTKDQIQQTLQQQVAGGGQGVQQQLQAAQSQLTKMQNGLSKYGAGGQDLDMPDFQPNTQKTKPFLKRLEYGINAQFIRSSTEFPATGDFGLTLGYKLNSKSTAGVGVGYTMGLGTNWNNIAFSSQGAGLRSFMDWKIKKTWYVTGGYELNHLTTFGKFDQLYHWNAWQSSALLGLEMKYHISGKVQGTLQLLFDALYKQETPPGQAIKFRVGYNF